MAVYTENGITIRWNEPGLMQPEAAVRQGTPARLEVMVSPAHHANAVTALYRIDGGAEREARGFPAGTGPSAREQRFIVDLPSNTANVTIAYRPVVSCSGRSADPVRGGHPPSVYRVTPVYHPGVAPGQAPKSRQGAERFAFDMAYLGRVTAPLSNKPEMVGTTPDGLQIVFPLGEKGTVRGPWLNGNILHYGGDWMKVRPDGIGISGIRVVIQAENGGTIMGEYGGVVDFGEDGYSALAAGGGPKIADVQLVPRYLTADKDLKWINRLQCIGVGRVDMTTLVVEYDLYGLNSLAAEKATGNPHA